MSSPEGGDEPRVPDGDFDAQPVDRVAARFGTEGENVPAAKIVLSAIEGGCVITVQSGVPVLTFCSLCHPVG